MVSDTSPPLTPSLIATSPRARFALAAAHPIESPTLMPAKASPRRSRATPAPGASSCDVLVVGGGVHGAAIARDAALRGLSVVLAEKNDFGCGTSSRSSKLAHGGLRYLEHFEMGLVRESLHERDALLKVAPHLAWPLPFLIPLTGPKPRAGWKVRIGLSLYDLLAGRSSLGHHDVLTSKEAVALAPALDACGMDRAARYWDAGMDDARIVVELVVDAASLGASCENHAKVTRLLRHGRRVVGARIQSADGSLHDVSARAVVLSAGPWLDTLASRRPDGRRRLALTKGAHVFVRRQLVKDAALMLAAPQDGRIFFVIPWKGGSLVGTTDTAFEKPADRVKPESDDVKYLIAAVNKTLPAARIKPDEIVAAQAGLRPLVAPDRPDRPSSISRDWKLDSETPGLFIVEGGKYTVFRRLAERVMDAVVDSIHEDEPEREIDRCTTHERMLPGGAPDWQEARAAVLKRLSRRVGAETACHLVQRYGMRAVDVVAAAGRQRELLRPACDDHPHVGAEAVLAVREELAKTPSDALLRRLDLPWWDCGGLRCRATWERALTLAGLPTGTLADGMKAWERELARDWRA